jgi:hypothetical protein
VELKSTFDAIHKAKQAQGSSTRTSHMARLLRWLVGKPEGRPLKGGERWIAALTARPLSRVEEEKKFLDIGESCPIGVAELSSGQG